LDFEAGFKAADLVAFFAWGFAGLVLFFAAGFEEALGFTLFAATLEAAEAFLVFGSALAETFEEVFFAATVAFANMTSR
jgi:hypothetical protein